MLNEKAISTPLRQAAESRQLPGVVAAAATADGVIYEGAFGSRDLATGAPMTTDTVVWIASMTKAITATCAMQQVEQGRLSLDGDIAAVVPELRQAQVLEGFDAAGKPQLRAPRRPITLRHLLTHTAGFSYDMWSEQITRYMAATDTPGVITCRNAALTTPLLFDPGEKWEYGISIDWAGKAVEAVSGQSLSDYMQANLLQPLGMTDTGFRIGPSQRQRLARIHTRGPAGDLTATDTEIEQEPEFHMGGGGLYSTVGDYLRFARMIMLGGTLDGVQMLKPETVASMSQNAMGNVVCEPMKTAHPAVTLDVDFLAGMKWGLSFLVNPEPMPTGRSANSLAWAGLANSFYWIDPHRKVTGVYATQVLPFFDPPSIGTFEAFETEVYRAIGK